jgi:hypothetical protein
LDRAVLIRQARAKTRAHAVRPCPTSRISSAEALERERKKRKKKKMNKKRNEETYQIEKVLFHTGTRGENLFYKIWWKRYPKEEATEEPEAAIAGFDEETEYWKNHAAAALLPASGASASSSSSS